MLESKVLEKYHDNELRVWETEHPEIEARMAMGLAERWGMVAAMADGEDSSGRAKLRLATPEEVVSRAVATAELLMKEMREKGWIFTSHSLDDILTKEEVGDICEARGKRKLQELKDETTARKEVGA